MTPLQVERAIQRLNKRLCCVQATSGGGGETPGLQAVITEDPQLMGANVINTGVDSFTIEGGGDIGFISNGTSGLTLSPFSISMSNGDSNIYLSSQTMSLYNTYGYVNIGDYRDITTNMYSSSIRMPNISSTGPGYVLTDLYGTGTVTWQPGPVRNGIVWGGIVTWVEDYTYEITAAGYYIDGMYYTSPARTVAGGNEVTLSPADPTDGRIDVFVVDTTSSANVEEGMPSSTPEKPSLSLTQLELSFALVEAGTTEPTIDEMVIYRQNLGQPTEWAATTNAPTRIVLGSLVTPIQDTISINTNSSINGDTITLTDNASFVPTSLHTVLTFWIRPEAQVSLSSTIRLRLSFKLGASLVGKTVALNTGTFGYTATSQTVQTISIPLSTFGLTNTSSIDRLFIENVSTGSSVYNVILDNIRMQGIPITTASTNFLALTDTPNTYTGQGGKVVAVNAGGTALEFITASSGGTYYFEVTKAQLDTAITNSTLVKGAIYRISNADIALYNDGTSGGTAIYLEALDVNKISSTGFGRFYNPKYNQATSGFGIWHTGITSTIGSKAIWGGYSWTNATGVVGTATSIFALSAAWTKDTYSLTNYNISYDYIEYDYVNDLITRRREERGNNDVSSLKRDIFQHFGEGSAIAHFQWGNAPTTTYLKGISNNTVSDSIFSIVNFRAAYINNNIVTQWSSMYFTAINGGGLNNNHFRQADAQNLSLDNSHVEKNVVNQSSINGTLVNSQINNNSITNASEINMTLTYASFDGNQVGGDSRVEATFDGTGTLDSSINGIFNCSFQGGTEFDPAGTLSGSILKLFTEGGSTTANLTAATIVYGDYSKTMYKRPDGAVRLRYYNNSDALVITTITT